MVMRDVASGDNWSSHLCTGLAGVNVLSDMIQLECPAQAYPIVYTPARVTVQPHASTKPGSQRALKTRCRRGTTIRGILNST